jgi:hypothetical protein
MSTRIDTLKYIRAVSTQLAEIAAAEKLHALMFIFSMAELEAAELIEAKSDSLGRPHRDRKR